MDLLQATFTAFNTIRERKPYTIYEIEVRSSATITWVIYKRYSAFHNLHQELLKVLDKVQNLFELPALPPKRLARSLANEFVEKRKAELQVYLSALLKNPEIVRHPAMLKFLEVPDSVRPMIVRGPSVDGDLGNDDIMNRSALSREERKVYDLVSALQSHPCKVAALKSYEKFFFESRPNIGSEFIKILFVGYDGNVGLVETCGNFDYSHVSAKASFALLCRLLDIERNRDASKYLEVFLRIDFKILVKLRLDKHIITDCSTGAYKIASMIIERSRAASIEKLIPDAGARKSYFNWTQRRHENISSHTKDSKESFMKSPTLHNVEYKSLIEGAFEEVAKIADSDQGWRFVTDELNTAIQVVYKKASGSDNVILRAGMAIAQDADQVFELLMDMDRRRNWDVKFSNGRVVKEIGENVDIVYESYKSFSSPYKYRDLCLVRAHRKEADGGYSIAMRSVAHSDVPEVKDSVRASIQASGFIITPYTMPNEKGDPIPSTLLLWIAQLGSEACLIYTPDLLGETNELFRSFHNLRMTLFGEDSFDLLPESIIDADIETSV